GPRMGTPTTLTREAFHGYYDGHIDTYLNTDVSDRSQAKAMHVNYAPLRRAAPPPTPPDIYPVRAKPPPGQLAVFGSEPGEASYSPVWKETILTWKSTATPVLIKSDTQIDQLGKKEIGRGWG